MSVLVVARDFALLAAVRAQLPEERVFFATDDASALAVAARRRPEIIFIEVKRHSGLKLIEKMSKTADVVVVARRDSAAYRAAGTYGAVGVMPPAAIPLATRRMIEINREYRAGHEVRS